MAVGRWDLELDARAYWARMLGSPIQPDDLLRMHPLRPSPPKPKKTPEQKKQESKEGWSMVMEYFSQRSTKRKG